MIRGIFSLNVTILKNTLRKEYWPLYCVCLTIASSNNNSIGAIWLSVELLRREMIGSLYLRIIRARFLWGDKSPKKISLLLIGLNWSRLVHQWNSLCDRRSKNERERITRGERVEGHFSFWIYGPCVVNPIIHGLWKSRTLSISISANQIREFGSSQSLWRDSHLISFSN